MTRGINPAGVDLVKHFEGFFADAYVCPAGVLTIGYGHTGDDVTEGLCIDEARAEQLLREDLSSACAAVERLVRVALSENQFAALASFAFNCGAGNLEASTLLRKLNQGDYAAVPSELNRWVMATDPATRQKRRLPGLVRRREAEGELWATPDSVLPAPGRATPQRVEPPDDDHRHLVTARSGLRLRAAPDLASSTLEVLPCGAVVSVVRRRDDWVQVDKNGDGLVDGWVFADYLSPVA